MKLALALKVKKLRIVGKRDNDFLDLFKGFTETTESEFQDNRLAAYVVAVWRLTKHEIT